MYDTTDGIQPLNRKITCVQSKATAKLIAGIHSEPRHVELSHLHQQHRIRSVGDEVDDCLQDRHSVRTLDELRISDYLNSRVSSQASYEEEINIPCHALVCKP